MPKLFDNGTNTQGVIVYGGVDSSNYGIVVGESPAFERPVRKQTIVQVPGRNGSVLFQENAWEDVTRTYSVWLDEDIANNKSLADKVNDYQAALNSLTGYQMLTDNFEPDVYRLAYYSGGDQFTNEMTQYGRANLRFVCRPERFLVSGADAVEVDDGDTLTNPTPFASKPLIHIEASNETISVSIGGKTITAEVTDYINIDCERMNAYRLPVENRNDKISGSFPTIPSGNNTIGITGNYTKVEITPNYFTI